MNLGLPAGGRPTLPITYNYQNSQLPNDFSTFNDAMSFCWLLRVTCGLNELEDNQAYFIRVLKNQPVETDCESIELSVKGSLQAC